MRSAGILSSIVLVLFLFIQAHAIEPGAIAEPSMPTPDMSMPKPIITKPNMDMPETNPKTEASQETSTNQTINQTGNLSSNQSQGMDAEGIGQTSLGGDWLMKFDGRGDKTLALTLWSSVGERIMGYGTLTELGRASSVTASGSLAEEELTLAIKSGTPEYVGQTNKEHNLDLFVANDTMSGTYILKSGGQFMNQGNVTAAKQ